MHRARQLICIFLTTALFLLFGSCGGGNSASTTPNEGNSGAPIEIPEESPLPKDRMLFTEVFSKSLDADGINSGLSAYDLIRNFGGPRPIESPDLYLLNHTEVEHIVESNDELIGQHFVFKAHRDLDRDRDKLDVTDRQRNEIKTYDKSEEGLKGFENETMVFTWKFKINESMEVSKKFTHLFQLKAVGGNESQPVVSFTGNDQSSGDGLEVRQSPLEEYTSLARVDWAEVKGEWLSAYVRATFSNDGNLRVIVSRISDDKVIFDIDQTGLDMWRGESDEHFVRPKWGIYRSIADKDNLREEEEIVRFANFLVRKVEPSN